MTLPSNRAWRTFRLIGGEANSIVSRKRPPPAWLTIVLKNGKPIMSLGAAGGPTIISQVLLTIINVVDFGMDLKRRFCSPASTTMASDELKIESKIGPEVTAELTRRGHGVTPVESLGASRLLDLARMGRACRGDGPAS